MRKLRVSQPLPVVMLAVVVTFGAVALLPYKPGLAVNDERVTSSVQAVANVTNTKDQIDRPLFYYQRT
jgi:hypothetical protein